MTLSSNTWLTLTYTEIITTINGYKINQHPHKKPLKPGMVNSRKRKQIVSASISLEEDAVLFRATCSCMTLYDG